MLQIIDGPAIMRDDYCIVHKENGLDELHFTLSARDQVYQTLREEKTRILETEEQQRYVVRKISDVSQDVAVVCVLDLADWRRDVFLNLLDLASPGFAHNMKETNMLREIMSAPGLDGWTMINQVQTSKRNKMEMDGPTPLEAALQLQKTFGCALRFDTIGKTVTILYPDEIELSNSYAVDSVNLRRPPEYKGHSSDLVTRIYPVGRNGLGIASINGGKPYVQNLTYTDQIISQLWVDERYTDAEDLLQDSKKRVKELSSPVQTWWLNVADLHRIDPDRWPDLSMELFTVIKLVDTARNISTQVQVREDKVYPYYPARNSITVSTAKGSIQQSVRKLAQALSDPNGEFWQKLNARR